ncbi:sperm-associated antigen 17-like [Vespula maculifrons]|uniref:Sperm-associated antigen 17-like n=1 Tax=Vespula maculifrons TaxID=7453 RepID=A0ABD2BBP6_VESMC
MSKKKSSKTVTSVKSKKQYNENAWQELLESLSINDDHWWCIVTMMVETRSDHARCVSMFNEAAEEGKRKAIYTLSHQKMLANVRSLSRQDPDKCPVLQRVCHHANKLLEANIESTWSLARVIKYMIYRAKIEAVFRIKKERELKQAIEAEYYIMQTVVDPTTSKNVKKKNDQSLRNKANTRLRIREEEWRDIVYIDDAPLDGPNLYVVLTGFHDPDLFVELMNIGVPMTCILKIKRPGETLQHISSFNEEKNQHTDRIWLRFPGSYAVDKVDLYKFWTSLKNTLKDPQAIQTFSNIAFLTFKPPFLAETLDDLEYKILKKDIFDKVSFIVYDLYDLLRKHSNYLRSMLIQRYDIDEKEEAEANVYHAILDALPTECVTVPTLLNALLLQVEANLDLVLADRSFQEQNVSAKENVVEKEENEEEEEKEEVPVESIDDDEDSWVRERIKLLNQKYKVKMYNNIVEENSNELPIELILRGDKLTLNTRCIKLDDNIKALLNLSDDMSLADSILQVYQDSRIIDCWVHYKQLTETKMKEYDCYINNIMKYFDPNVGICRQEIFHYLHFLIFDKMIYGDELNEKDEKIERLSIISSLKSPRRILTDPSLLLPKDEKEESRFFSKSDTEIDYGKAVAAFLSCPSLFGLTDIREVLLPSYLEKNVFEGRDRRMQRVGEPLEEYDDVELLPKRVLLQTFYKCFQNFERFEKRYFEPTDSILLYFSNDYVKGDVSERSTLSSLRTPVCLRDFVKYVYKEEIDWINREEEKDRSELIKRTSKSSIGEISSSEDELHFYFGDEHFILPNSLKAQDMKKKLQVDSKYKDSSRLDTPRTEVIGEKKIPKGNEKKKGDKTLSEKISLKDKKQKTNREINEIDTSFLPRRKILSFESAKEDEPHEFIGYDLGNLRVQIVEKSKIFNSEDGTFVQVNLETWLYEKVDLRITITLAGCTLRLFEKLNDRKTSNVFHVTTNRGIVLAFSKKIDTTPDEYWKELKFDFHASWPSGLTISPVTGDGPENPFYITQSYISKAPEDVAREAYRKFLRNGTVLKFLNDNTVIVLRPNGTVIECTLFEDITTDEKNFEEDHQINQRNPSDITLKKNLRKKRLNKTEIFEEENVDVEQISSKMMDELMNWLFESIFLKSEK